MRLTAILAVTFLLLSQASAASAQSVDDVVRAFESGIKTAADFDTVFEFVLPSEKDTRWRQVPWIPSLWEGMQIAAQKKKPMFIWAMNGDPLGCV